jgi:hypothetical protein
MEAKSPGSTAHAFVNAINRHDLDALLALMSPSHCMIDALGNTISRSLTASQTTTRRSRQGQSF